MRPSRNPSPERRRLLRWTLSSPSELARIYRLDPTRAVSKYVGETEKKFDFFYAIHHLITLNTFE
jgi:hypothetical protein